MGLSLSLVSAITTLSSVATVTEDNSEGAKAKDTVPEVPPPLRPKPAVTPSISPCDDGDEDPRAELVIATGVVSSPFKSPTIISSFTEGLEP